jgi:hypothetical protein
VTGEPAVIRPYVGRDHDQVAALADRLAFGVAAWRSAAAAAHAAHQWIDTSTSREAGEGAAYVAERRGSVIGFVSVST